MKTGSFETDAGRAARIAEKRAKEIDRAFANGMSNVKKNIIGVGVALIGINSAAAIAQKAFAGVSASIDYADKVNALSLQLGISAEKISALGYAAQQSGSDLDSVGAAIPKLSKKIAETADKTGESARLFKALGVEVRDSVTGKLREAIDVLPDLQDKFKSLTSDTLEQSLAMELFGKSGAQMLEFLNIGSDASKALEDRLASLGGTISQETAAAADEFKDKLAELNTVGQALALQVMEQLLPQLTELVVWATEFTSEASNARDIAESLSTVFGLLVNTGTIVGDVFRLVGNYMAAAAAAATGFANIAAGLISMDWSRISKGLLLAEDGLKGQVNALVFGVDNQGKSLTRYGSKPSGAATDTAGIDFSNVVSSAGYKSERDGRLAAARAARLRDAEERLLSGFFAGPPKKKPDSKPEKSEEAKRAEELIKAYESLNSSQLETIALFGKEGEAAKVTYEIQSGSLKGLDKAKAAQLVSNAESIDQLKIELELKTKLDDLAESQAKKFEDTLASIRAETEALGMSNIELEIRNNLISAGVKDSSSAQGVEIIDATKNLEKLREVTDAMDAARSIGYDFLVDLPNSGKDAWKNALDSIESMLLQWAAKGIIDQLFGEQGTAGKGSAGGGWLSSLFAAFSGSGASGSSGASGASGSGGGWISMIASMFGGGRADGGPVYGGKMHPVNERGTPELLTFGNKQLLMMPPGANGRVTPMRTGGGNGGGFTQVINNNYSAPTDPRTQTQVAAKAGFEAQRALRRNS